MALGLVNIRGKIAIEQMESWVYKNRRGPWSVTPYKKPRPKLRSPILANLVGLPSAFVADAPNAGALLRNPALDDS
jgi:hypothetical protein